jgi:hypothetical protein
LAPGDFEPLAVEAVHVNEETIIGMLRKGVDANLVRSKFYVGLDEKEHIKRRPVAGALAHLTDVASGIIALFGWRFERRLSELRWVVWDRPVGMTEITIQLDDSTSDKISYSSVGFLKFENNNRDATPAGSGVFARLGKVSGIITAGHVFIYREWDELGSFAFPVRILNCRIIELRCSTQIVLFSGPRSKGTLPTSASFYFPKLKRQRSKHVALCSTISESRATLLLVLPIIVWRKLTQ